MTRFLKACFSGVWLLAAVPASANELVSDGGGLDYMPSVVQPWGEEHGRLVVFERLHPDTLFGDLLLTESNDGGVQWSKPITVIASSDNERHPALIQTGQGQFQLFYLSSRTGYRIHRASSVDGETFVHHGPIDLGWPTPGEVNPHVIRHDDGTLTMTYQRLTGAVYLAQSTDGGLSWDQHRTQLSPDNAMLARIAYRERDGMYLAVYQTNPGNHQLRVWARTTIDPYNWVSSPQEIAPGGNNHDAMPLLQRDGRFVVLWSRVADGGFQVFSSESDTGADWSAPLQHTMRPDRHNIQPHGLILPSQALELYWGAAHDLDEDNYDIVRRTVRLRRLFFDRFEP